jgi:hypothetical protein
VLTGGGAGALDWTAAEVAERVGAAELEVCRVGDGVLLELERVGVPVGVAAVDDVPAGPESEVVGV